MRRSSILFFLKIVLFSSLIQAQENNCAAIAALDYPNTTFTLAESVTAGDFIAPDGQTYAVPAFCRVQGVARPTADSHINFEIWLPGNGWNGRYYQLGNGGFASQISYAGLASYLQAGNAVAMTDTGHEAKSAVDATWALNHPEKIVDWGHRSIKATKAAAKAAIAAFYGKVADYRYFAGCSTGGRQALTAAQRYPEDWDGILAGAPSSHQQFVAFGWNQLMLRGDAASSIPPTKLPAIQRAALAACSADAHVVDGIAADPRFCRFDPAVLACEDEETDECLTQKQITALRNIYTGPRLADGKQVYPGFEPTMEATAHDHGVWKDGWVSWLAHETPSQAAQFGYANGLFAYMIYDNPAWDFRTFDLDAAYRAVLTKDIAGEPFAAVLNTPKPDLSAFQQRGGKLLMYMGWGDSAVAPQSAIDYYETITHPTSSSAASTFARLYMVPGMMHCMGGPGATAFGQFSTWPALKEDPKHNILRALEAWVEQGVAPGELIAAQYVDNKPEAGVSMTRPLCPYPQVPVYRGEGSTKEANQFSCIAGKRSGS